MITEFTKDQLDEIRKGQNAGLNVSVYAKPDFYAIQMRQIRKGMMEGLPVEQYARTEYDWFQMEEIRKGLKEHLDVSFYASPEVSYEKMRQIRKGLREGIDLSKYAVLDAGILRELRKGIRAGVNLVGFIQQGYDTEQLEQIRIALEKGLPIENYITTEFRGISISEISKGLEEGLDVSVYANMNYGWQQMREIRLGMEHQIDVGQYILPFYSWQQMREIRLGLENNIDIQEYRTPMYTANDMRICREKLELRNIEHVISNVFQSVEHQKFRNFTITVSEDGMEAYIEVTGTVKSISRKAIEAGLSQKGIVSGICEDVIDNFSKGNICRKPLIIAKGTRPQDGKDGWYEYFFKTEGLGKPKLLPDGTVDYLNAEVFQTVKKGQKLAVYHEAEEGTDGRNILGGCLQARKGKEQNILVGRGFERLPDGKTYISLLDGKVDLQNNRLMVSKLLILEEVTAATGNVRFDGSVYVQGNVGNGVLIKASEDIVVDGYVESAALEAGANVFLRKGANSPKNGYIKAAGNICGKFFESVRLYAEKDIMANYCLNCETHAKGTITISSIAGGIIYVEGGLKSYYLGNRSGLSTIVMLGFSHEAAAQLNNVQRKLKEADQELGILRNAYWEFQKKYPAEIRNGMEIYLKIEKAIYTKKKQKEVLNSRREHLEERIQTMECVEAVVKGRLYEGVTIETGSKKWMAKELKNVTVTKTRDRIAIYAN